MSVTIVCGWSLHLQEVRPSSIAVLQKGHSRRVMVVICVSVCVVIIMVLACVCPSLCLWVHHCVALYFIIVSTLRSSRTLSRADFTFIETGQRDTHSDGHRQLQTYTQ